MAQKGNEHKFVNLTYDQNTIKVKIPKINPTAQKTLKAITKKIQNKFKLNINQHFLSFNDTVIELDDAEQLQQELSNHKPVITFVVSKKSKTETQLQQDRTNYFNFMIHYGDNKPIKYPFIIYLKEWTDDMLYNLKLKTKESFQIRSDVELCEDKDMEYDIDDIDDLKTFIIETIGE
eukprot:214440_1